MSTTTDVTDVADAIDRAASIIEARGLCHVTLTDGCRVCAVGGLAAAVYGDPELGYLYFPGLAGERGREPGDVEFYNAVVRAVVAGLYGGNVPAYFHNDPVRAVYRWNDGGASWEQEDQAEVVGTFRRIAATLRTSAVA